MPAESGNGVRGTFRMAALGAGTVVVMLVIFAALAGILTTWLIISRVAQNTAMKRRFEYEAKFDELQEQAHA